MAQVLGIVDLNWRNQTLDIEKGAKLKLGGMKQNGVVTNRAQHFSQEFEGSEITATIPIKSGMSVLGLFAGGTGPLTAKCDTGQVFQFDDAFITNRPEMTGGEGGKTEIKWGASESMELVNG